MSAPLKKIVIVGRDADAWLTVLMSLLAFSRINDGIEIEFLELPTKITEQDTITALPSIKALHDSLGLDERKLVNLSSGLYSFGQRYSNWSGAAAPFIHAYDTQGTKINGIDFLQYWIKAKKFGLNVALEEFSMGAAAAKQGYFVLHNEKTKSFSRATYGLNLATLKYLQVIAKAAKTLGIKHKQVADVSVCLDETGRIEAVSLPDGTRVYGDLFIDTSGEQAILIDKLEENNFESWRHWFRSDRMIVADANVLAPLPSYSQISAFNAGWVAVNPLVDKSNVTALYSSQAYSDDEVVKAISVVSGLQLNNVVLSGHETGVRKKAWIKNCVALGSASANLEPLDAVQLSMLHLGLINLVKLFPREQNCMPEAEIFNRKMNSHVERIRDFQLTHYKLNQRFKEPFWDACRSLDIPQTLAHQLNVFSNSGRLVHYEDDPFFSENWASILIGHGLIPDAYDPLVDSVNEQQQIQHFQLTLKYIGEQVSEMPSMQSYMELHG